MSSDLHLEHAGEDYKCAIRARKPALQLSVGEATYQIDRWQLDAGGRLSFSLNGVAHEAVVVRDERCVHVRLNGRSFEVGFSDALADAGGPGGGEDELRADMPGVVVEVKCAPGDTVSAGDTLLVIESMKMQIRLVAPRDGTIAIVHMQPQSAFEKGNALVTLESTVEGGD